MTSFSSFMKMSFRDVIGSITIILGCFSIVIVRSESQSTLNHLEPIDRIGPNDCKDRMDFYPFKKCCACKYKLISIVNERIL